MQNEQVSDLLAQVRPLQRDDNDRLLDLWRACPLEADFTFYFARGPDFFAWPDAMFYDYRYQGIGDGDRLSAALLIGLARGETGAGPGSFFYTGDARVLPEHRGSRLAERIVIQMSQDLPPEVRVGFGIIKKGNLPAERVARTGELPRYRHAEIGTFTAYNIVPFRRISHPGVAQVRRARPEDLPDLADLMARCFAGRLFAPVVTADSLAAQCERLAPQGLGLDRYYVAERGGRLVGGVAAWDMSPMKRSVILRYSRVAQGLRLAHRGLRLAFPGTAPMPDVGQAFRSLSLTQLAIYQRNPDVLRDLLAQVIEDHLGQGYHLIHLGFVGDDPLKRVTRGLLAQRFESGLLVGVDRHSDLLHLLDGRCDPYLDLAIL